MKQTELPKENTTWGEGGSFIEHLIVYIQARHCRDIMAASAIIILQKWVWNFCILEVCQEMGWLGSE